MAARSSLLWRSSTWLGSWLFGLVILFEQWGWRPLARAMGRLSRWAPIARLETRITRLPPRTALAVFLLPELLLLPVKLAAVLFIARGRLLAGTAILVGAKVVSTGIVARIFVLTRPRLLEVAWFADAYARWLIWRERALCRVRRSAPWRLTRIWMRRARQR